jgi:hypothetical protein
MVPKTFHAGEEVTRANISGSGSAYLTFPFTTGNALFLYPNR